MQTQGLAAFVDDLSGGLILVSLSVVIGAIAWGLVVLRGSREGRELLQRCLALMRIGALALAAAQAVKIIAKAGVVAASLDAFPWTDYAATAQFQASLARVVLALMIAACARLPLRTRSGWPVLTALAVALMLSGAWLIHGAGRLEARAPLMALTVLHQLAAAIWVGGVIQLLALWHRSRGTELQSFWPIAIARFSSLGIAAVALLLATGVTLAWHYVGSWQGLLGTGYGSLVLAKTWLLAVTLAFAGLNFFRGPALAAESDQRCGRRARAVSDRSRSVPAGRSPVPCGKRIVAAAGSGHSRSDRQLPRGGADVRTEDAAAGHPDTPRLSHRRGGAQRAGRQAAVCSGHAMVGLQPQHRRFVLTAMGIVALLSYVRGSAWARFWPSGFMALGVFLFFRSDAETWPLGLAGFWQSMLGDTEVLQHRIATALAFALGALEARSRASTQTRLHLRFLFPVLCAFGGILLVTHVHTPFEIKRDYLIQSTHLAMGLLALIMAAGRWLELRLPTHGCNWNRRQPGSPRCWRCC